MAHEEQEQRVTGFGCESVEVDDKACLEAVLDELGHGCLGVTLADGCPRVFPVNFVLLDRQIYFHGGPQGEKMSAIAHDARVGFTVVDAGSLVPSYSRDQRSACPATQYYRSVMVRGRARIVTDVHEKGRALQALMEKLQPEGGHEPICGQSKLYEKALRATAVVAIEIDSMSGKFKYGQNLTEKVREQVVNCLTERAGPADGQTVQRMLAWSRHPTIVQDPPGSAD